MSSVLKLVSVDDFELYVFSFGFASFDLCSLAARAVIAGELILGLGLVSGWWHNFVNSVTAALLVGFSGFLIWRMAAGDGESCHCFGNLVEMNPAQSLVKNARPWPCSPLRGAVRPSCSPPPFMARQMPSERAGRYASPGGSAFIGEPQPLSFRRPLF